MTLAAIPEPRIPGMREKLVAWAGARACLLCREKGALHAISVIEGARGPRLALLRTVPVLHEFDPGDRRFRERR